MRDRIHKDQIHTSILSSSQARIQIDLFVEKLNNAVSKERWKL